MHSLNNNNNNNNRIVFHFRSFSRVSNVFLHMNPQLETVTLRLYIHIFFKLTRKGKKNLTNKPVCVNTFLTVFGHVRTCVCVCAHHVGSQRNARVTVCFESTRRFGACYTVYPNKMLLCCSHLRLLMAFGRGGGIKININKYNVFN